MSLRPLVFTTRRTAGIASVAALSLLVPLMGPSPAVAAGEPDDVRDVRIGLIKLGGALAGAAEQPALSDDLPLTDTSVRDLLSLDTVIGTLVTDALSAKGDTTLDTIDEAFPKDGPLVVEEVDAKDRLPGAPANSREWTMKVSLKASRKTAMTYQKDELEFGTARLGGDLAASLDGTIRFRYDPDEKLALRNFAVVGTSELTTHVWSREAGKKDGGPEKVDVPDFTAVDGFIQLDGSGEAKVDSSTVLSLRDPNGRGQITTEDLEFSAASELFQTTQAPGADDIAIDLDLSTSMDDSATGTVKVGTRAKVKDGETQPTYAAPVVDRSATLKDLTSLTRVQAMSGFTQYASAVQSVEASVDQQFPLVDLSLTDLYSPAQQLQDLITEQATATIVCGAADTSPPSGAPQPGEARYCQAVTAGFVPASGEKITWESPDKGVDIAADSTGRTGTVGTSPTKNVKVTGGDGFPTLRVTFTSEDGKERVARSAVRSIQALGDAIKQLGLDGEVVYDPTKQALEIKVRDDEDDDKGGTYPTGGNGNLAPLTGLTGLCQAIKGSNPRLCSPTGEQPNGTVVVPQEGEATVKVGSRTFDADFGIGLVKPTPAVEGQPVQADPTYYLVPGDDGRVYEIDDASASLGTDAKLGARIGFLSVDVDVTSYSVSQSGKAASVKVPTSTVPLPSKGEIDDAVTLSDLLDPSLKATLQRGLTAKADLTVKDTAQDSSGKRPIGADGTVKAEWTSLLTGSLPKVETGGGFDKLRLLDIVPARQATMGDGSADGVIQDPTADFLKQFGLTSGMTAAERTVTRPLYDLGTTEASSVVCTQFVVSSPTKLECQQGPLSKAGVVGKGHPYVIEGDPDALRDVVMEDLAGVLNSFTTAGPEVGADKTFPLVDLRPTDISAARDSLGATIRAIQDTIDAGELAKQQSVSSLQSFRSTFEKQLKGSVEGEDVAVPGSAKIGFALKGNRLELETSLDTTGTRDATMKVATGNSEVKVYSSTADDKDVPATLPVDVESGATFALGIDLADASSQVRGDTAVTEKITKISGDADRMANVRKTLGAKATDYGSARVTSGPDSDVRVGIDVQAATGADGTKDDWSDLAALPQKLTQKRSVAGSGLACVDGSGKDPKIAACLRLPIDSTPAIATVEVDLAADQSSGGKGGSVAAKPIAYRFLAEGLSKLNLTLADALDGDLAGTEDGPLSLPVVGIDLDGSADVPKDVETYVSAVRSKLSPVEKAVAETASITDLDTELAKAITAVSTQLGAGTNKITTSNKAFVYLCAGGVVCDPKTKKVSDIQQISVPVTLEGALGEKDVPFRAGPAGSTIITDRSARAEATWKLDVTVGIGRGTGPFVKLPAVDPAKPLLDIDLTARLQKNSTTACHEWSRSDEWKTKVGDGSGSGLSNLSVSDYSAGSDNRCIDAFVGKFPSVLVDRPKSDGTAGTFLKTSIAVDVEAPAGTTDGIVYAPTLADKVPAFTTTATGTGGLSTYFESFASKAGFFDVLGTIDQVWKDGVYEDVKYGLLRLDVGTLNKAVFPGFKKALAWTAPLNPVVEQLSKPIPVVTNLSELVGQGPTSLLTLLQKKNTPINLIVNLLQMQNVIAGEPDEKAVDLVEIGGSGLQGFKVEPYKQGLGTKCTEKGTANGKPFKRVTDGKVSPGKVTSGRCKPGTITKLKQLKDGKEPEKDPAGLKIDKTITRTPYLSLPSVSLPVLQDTSQIFGLLQDTGDATMLYVDLGHAGVAGSITRKFGPFAVGPIPLTASIGGTVTLDGRFAFGFDTRGLSRKIEALDTGSIAGFDALYADGKKLSVFSDGFYIDDLEKGVDVPEIKLSFMVQAGAAISIGIVEAGISGGATLDLSLDAFDPNGDGKIYTDEFAAASNGPGCAFNVSSGISFFLQFYFAIEFVFYTFQKQFDIVRSPRYSLFDFNCKPETPVLAVKGTLDGKESLVLTMGDIADSKRNGFKGDVAEKYTVRQVGVPDSKGDVLMQVTAFNLTQNYVVPKGTPVVANAGTGSDTVRLYAMPAVTTDADGDPVLLGPADDGYVPPTFDSRAVISGGLAADTIETSDGDDIVDGDEGNDTIRGGGGDDTLRGGTDADQVDGGQGTDTLEGGAGDDRVNGGAGADDVRGDDGDDSLEGGVGASRLAMFDVTSANDIRPLLDAGDLVVGGNGADTINGGDGSDVVVGGAYSGKAAFTAKDKVTVDAQDADKKLLRVDVNDIATVALPSDEQVRTQCADPGEDGETGPDVVSGGADRDIVIGGAGGDDMSGGAGADTLCGRGGDDLLQGDGSAVELDEQGDDLIGGGPGRDRIYGAGGRDTLRGGADDDLIRGGVANDDLAGGAGSDLLLGESGTDTVMGDAAAGETAIEAVTADSDPKASGRLIACSMSSSVVGGRIDLDGDLSGTNVTGDTGQLEGMSVETGLVQAPNGGTYTGIVGDIVFIDGKVDVNGDGKIQARTSSALGDTGSVPLAGITGAMGNGDCILGGDEVDTTLDGGVGADYLDAGAGDDTGVRGGDGDDLVRGGAGDDTVLGDAGDDLVAGDGGADILYGNADADVLRGGSGKDLLAGGSSTADATDGADEVLGDGQDDVVLGGNATLSRTAIAETAISGTGVTLLDTPSAKGLDDKVYGGAGNDWVFAQDGDDEAYGGPGTDVVEGGPGADLVRGDDQADLLVGGSSTTGAVTTDRTATGVPDGGDTVVGDQGVDGADGSDVMVGDNARLQLSTDVRERWKRVRSDVEVELFDEAGASAPDADVSGADTLVGDGEADLVFGQGGNDTVRAGSGDDAVEGGAGADDVSGNAGNDALLGGSWTAGTADAGDDLKGGDGDDVLLGDNGRSADLYQLFVQLHDAPAAGKAPAAGTSGGDTLAGGAGDDRLFGQSGGDTIVGDAGVDALEGGEGRDVMDGGAGDDTLTGGSSSGDGRIVPDRSGAGQLDTGDVLTGGTGDDVVAGDNARLDTTGGTRADGTSLRSVLLFDLATARQKAPGGSSGDDVVTAGEGRDLVFGQGGGDSLAGGLGDDYLEGNDGADALDGGTGEDDLVGGGSSRTGAVITTSGPVVDRLLTAPGKLTDVSASGLLDGNDTLTGGDERDVLLGDNGRITRGGPPAVLSGGASGPHTVRKVAMADKQPGVWSGSDQLSGGSGDDDLYGQFDNTRTRRPGQAFAGLPSVPGDVLLGGLGDDALIGDQGVDVPTPAKSLGSVNRTLKDKKSFVREFVRPRGSLVRVVTMTHSRQGGDDVILGEGGSDSIHAGAGKDVVNAGADGDVVFGADGADALWGGTGHDRVFGGEGRDLLDIKRRGSHSALWRAVAPVEDTDTRRRTTNGSDLLYGGSGADGLQADEGDRSRTRKGQGDRLIDWSSRASAFKVCRTGRGTGKVMDEPSSSMSSTLRELARASGSVGSAELALPVRERITKYPGRPGFVCER
ncbi:calcium-binding protein [Aeromicrobium fastidiosum]|uniref:Calcium-binding protein n=1 Tax=Aeromicrobium fastidiosum TaxID=52699 RepID=A0A641APQ2_9ACTN|nr:calcium-binding protein [Aeromicrobium fastidiosum]KAA1378225.1 hypothetical protein ESP62_007545 [Aeromicrobium fastidiosum]MBP2388964.1 Ca2+-binding RTX toxin-like protein [Aeromicrobium fastidiosum]